MVKRIHYVPGLLSLALMLPLGLWYLHGQRAFRQERCFNMVVPAASDPTSPFQVIAWQPKPSDTLPDYRCIGDLETDLPILMAFRDSLESLAKSDDRSTVLHVRFGPKASYASVIHAIESCRRNTRTFSLDGLGLWAIYFPRAETKPTMQPIELLSAETLECGTQSTQAPRPIGIKLKDDHLLPLVTKLGIIWPSIPLFLVLMVFGIRKAKNM